MKTTIEFIKNGKGAHDFDAPEGHRLVTAERLDRGCLTHEEWRLFWEPVDVKKIDRMEAKEGGTGIKTGGTNE